MPAVNSPRRKFSFSAISSGSMAARRSRTGTLSAETAVSSRLDGPGEVELEANSLGLTQQQVKDLQHLHRSRQQTPPPSSLKDNNTSSPQTNNNFLLQFTLRRQSHVSLNRLFGSMGETPATGGRPGSQDTAGGGARKSVTSTSRPQHKSGHAEEIPSGTDHCQSASVRSGCSLIRLASEKRARKVRFYRNGDRFFKGMVYAVSTERFRTFESLLSSLTASPLCDSKVRDGIFTSLYLYIT